MVFLDEFALLVILAVSGASIDAPIVARLVLAVGLVVAAGFVWGGWLAPRAPRPIPFPQILLAKLTLFAAAATAFAAVGHMVGAVMFFIVSLALVVASEREDHRLDS